MAISSSPRLWPHGLLWKSNGCECDMALGLSVSPAASLSLFGPGEDTPSAQESQCPHTQGIKQTAGTKNLAHSLRKDP